MLCLVTGRLRAVRLPPPCAIGTGDGAGPERRGPTGGDVELVIFACVHNAGRSQMAAAFFDAVARRSRARAVSAGTRPADRVHPAVVEVMREVGLDLSAKVPRRLTEDLAREAALLVTMGCGDECPVVPGLAREDWPLPDPKDRPLEEVRQIRDEVRRRVEQLVAAHGW